MNCPICQSNHHSIIRKKLRLDVKRDVLSCKNCGFVFLGPSKNKINYSDKQYRLKYGPNLKKASSAKERFETYLPFQYQIIDKIKPLLKPTFSVLDVGCSTGHFLTALGKMVKTRVGIELSPDDVNFIKKNLDFKVYSEPIEKLSLTEGPFDLITSLQVLEHVEDPIKFLKSLRKNLKPNGILYLELPNIDDVLLSIFEETSYKDFYFREPHLSYFSAKTLKMALDKAGFVGKISTVQRYNFINHLHWLLTHGPQNNFALGNDTPTLAKGSRGKTKVGKQLNDFIKKIDREYKDILEKNNLGESLVFIGKIKK